LNTELNVNMLPRKYTLLGMKSTQIQPKCMQISLTCCYKSWANIYTMFTYRSGAKTLLKIARSKTNPMLCLIFDSIINENCI